MVRTYVRQESASPEILNIGKRTIYDLAHQGKLPHLWVGKQLRFDRETLVQWVREQIEASVKPAEPTRAPQSSGPTAILAVDWEKPRGTMRRQPRRRSGR